MADEVLLTREQELAEQFKEGLTSDAAVALAVEHEATVAALEQRISDAEAALATMKAAPKPRASVPKAAEPKPRRFKLLDGADERPVVGALRALVQASDDVEIAFIDNKGKEVAGTKPIAVGNKWRDHMLGLMLDEPVEIDGPGMGSSSYPIAGYALLVDGKHVATTIRSNPVVIAPGTKTKLENDIWF